MSKIVTNQISPQSGNSVTFNGDVSIGGTLTYEDVTNIDVVGVITARSGVVLSENNAIHFRGTAGDDLDSVLRESSSNTLLINSRNSARINIDSNNDGTGATFKVGTNGATGSTTDLVTILEDGKVGFGTNNPDRLLHVQASDASASSNAFDVAILERNDDCYLKILSANNKVGGINFGDTQGSYMGALYYDHSVNDLIFNVNESERMRIGSTGRVGIDNNLTNTYDSTYHQLCIGDGTGNNGMLFHAATNGGSYIGFKDTSDGSVNGLLNYIHNGDYFELRAAGSTRVRVDSDGLKFNTDTAAANALDDYEEGNGTPTVSFETSGSGTLAAGATYKYVKIGDLVTFSFEFNLSSVSSPSGGLRLNLPFASGAGVYSAGAVRLYNVTFTGSPFLQIGPSSSYVVVLGSVSGSANSKINGTGYYFGSISYRTSS
tara:strand:- start:763 stop:2061 length:1299 start_codon:yes stop_codon:yes gene_type:complete